MPFSVHDDKLRAPLYGENTQGSRSRRSRAHSIHSQTSQASQSKRSLGDIGEVDEILDENQETHNAITTKNENEMTSVGYRYELDMKMLDLPEDVSDGIAQLNTPIDNVSRT